MKKTVSFILIFCFLFCFSSCKAKQGPDTEYTDASAGDYVAVETTELVTVDSLDTDIAEVDVLVAYFSENDGVKEAAEFISETLNADIFRIETEIAYPDNEAERNARIKEEFSKKMRPVLKNNLSNGDKYGIIILCYPVWEGSLPMPVWTFAEDNDMYGKAVIPVCCGADGEGESLNELAALCRFDKLTLCYTFSDEKVDTDDLGKWINNVIFG